jgi:hypothetical protein
MLSFKPDVRLVELSDPLIVLLRACAQWSLRSSIGVEVNSIDDGAAVHMATSLHGWSLAADVDTVEDRAPDTQQLGEYLRRVLPAPWDVIFEGTHIHAEFDVHRPVVTTPA